MANKNNNINGYYQCATKAKFKFEKEGELKLPKIEKTRFSNEYDYAMYVTNMIDSLINNNFIIAKNKLESGEKVVVTKNNFYLSMKIRKVLTKAYKLIKIYSFIDNIFEIYRKNNTDNYKDFIFGIRRNIWRICGSLKKHSGIFHQIKEIIKVLPLTNDWVKLIDYEIEKFDRRIDRISEVPLKEFIEISDLNIYDQYLKDTKNTNLIDEIDSLADIDVDELSFDHIIEYYMNYAEEFYNKINEIKNDSKYDEVKNKAAETRENYIRSKAKRNDITEKEKEEDKLKNESILKSWYTGDLTKARNILIHEYIRRVNNKCNSKHLEFSDKYTLLFYSKFPRSNTIKRKYITKRNDGKFSVTGSLRNAYFADEPIEISDEEFERLNLKKYFIYNIDIIKDTFIDIAIGSGI